MALYFRLRYNGGQEYVDLFPKTELELITGLTNQYTKQIVPVTIPATTDTTQTITITASAELANSVSRMYLVSGSQEDYGTITQYQVNENQLVITRLYEKPSNTITVNLVFFVKETEV